MLNDLFRTTVTATLAVRNGQKAVDFYKVAFGAVEMYRVEDPDGAVVAQLSIDGATFWIADESPARRTDQRWLPVPSASHQS